MAKTVDSWKLEVMREVGLPPLRLGPREWALLLLYVDGQSPVVGEESFHIALFTMNVPPLHFKPLLLTFFSPDLHNAIKELVGEGLVKVQVERDEWGERRVFKLSEKGAGEAARLAEVVRGSWVFVGDVIVREGSKVLSELEALKKAYNGRDVDEWLDLALEKLYSQDNILERVLDEAELEYLKAVHKARRSKRKRIPLF